jgi:hypothetical protein
MKLITWGENLGRVECPYIKRWVFNFHFFSIRIHHWLHSDDARHFHDHPWWYLTLVLKGGYVDSSPDGLDILKMGSIRFRKATHKHSVLIFDPSWTILLTGPKKRVWGFWVGEKFKRRNKYFFKYGHHSC